MKVEENIPGYPVYLPEQGDPVAFRVRDGADRIEVRLFNGRLQIRASVGKLIVRPKMSGSIEVEAVE